MKNLTSLVCLLLLLCVGFISSGQNSLIKKGDEAFTLKNYGAAISSYEKAFEKINDNPTRDLEYRNLVKKLADCYRFTNQYEKARDFYALLSDLNSNVGERSIGLPGTGRITFEYADMLLRSGEIKEARKALKAMDQDDPAVTRMLKNCDFAEAELKKNLPEVYIENMGSINSEGSDFGLGMSNGKLVFATNRLNTKQSVLDGVYNQEFTDLYLATKTPGSVYWSEPEEMKGNINSAFNDGTFTQAPGKNWALITRCIKDPTKVCSIYRVTSSGDKWEKSEKVKTDFPEKNYGHPTLSSDGKTVYFSSDRPLPGKKGKNIFKAKYNYYTNSIDQILPVGDNINTDEDEMFPYLFKDSILFFASSGLIGMGGLDIYHSVIRDGFFENPVNMGHPVNSTADDFSVIINENMKGGYFCTNRENVTQGDDIYYTNMSIMDPIYVKVLNAVTNKGIENVSITNLPDAELSHPFTKLTDKNGVAELHTGHLPCDLKEHPFRFTRNGYDEKTIDIPCFSKDTIFVSMNPESGPPADIYYTLKGNVYDSISRKPIDKAKVVMSYDGKPQAETLTDGKGDFAFNNVPRNKRITLRVSKDNYYTDEKSFDTPSTKKPFQISTDTGYDTNFGLHPFPVPPLKLIFYDYDKFFLRPQSIIDLNYIVRLFRLNPELDIMIESHCDERGSDDYNIGLSERRGISVKSYLVSKGINPNRLKLKNFGKSRPAVDNAVTEEQHQLNRRTEFIANYRNAVGTVMPNDQQSAVTQALQGVNNPMKTADEENANTTKSNVNTTTSRKVVPQPNINFNVTSSNNPKDTVTSKGNEVDIVVDNTGNLVDESKTVTAPKTQKFVQPGMPVYRVQIVASGQTIQVESKYPAISDLVKKHGVNVEKVAGLNKYQMGNFSSFEEADSLRVLLQGKGFKDCFVVVSNK
jgi:outer membrane protein OmpA-like peptidoglycan-associated protein